MIIPLFSYSAISSSISGLIALLSLPKILGMFDKMDFDAAYPNALTCTVLKGAKVPVILKNDKTAIQAAIFTLIEIGRASCRERV